MGAIVSVSRKLATAMCLGSLVVAVAACGGGGSSSSSGSSGGGSSSSAAVTSYAAGSVITVASADGLSDISLTGLTNGNYLVAWSANTPTSGGGNGIYYRAYTPAGSAKAAVRLANTTGTNRQGQPVVAALKGGGFVIVWSDSGKIYMQRFDNGGGNQGSQLQVSTTANDGANDPRIIGLADGGYLISWTEFHPSGGVGPARTTIRARLFTSGGGTSGAEFQLTDISNERGWMYRIAPLSNGNFVFLLTTYLNRPGSDIVPNVTAQTFSPSGAAQGSAYYINDAVNGAWDVNATPWTDGGYLAVWVRTSYGVDIRSRRIDALNTLVGTETIYDAGSSLITRPRLTPLTSGRYVMAWHGYSNVTGQVFNADGTVFNARFDTVTGAAAVPDDLALGSSVDGSFAVSWVDGPGQLYRNLSLRIYAPRS